MFATETNGDDLRESHRARILASYEVGLKTLGHMILNMAQTQSGSPDKRPMLCSIQQIGSRSLAALALAFQFCFGLSIGAEAATVTYHTQHSTGVVVAPGVTTDWGVCDQRPSSAATTLMDTGAFDCDDDEVNLSSAGIFFESYNNTAFGAATDITGISFDAEFNGQGNPWTFRATIFYVDGAGTKTDLGSVTRAYPAGKDSTPTDLSSISGTVPAGSIGWFQGGKHHQ